MLVKAKVTHTQPGSNTYREEGEQFDHAGKLYKHVEVVKEPLKAAKGKPESEEE